MNILGILLIFTVMAAEPEDTEPEMELIRTYAVCPLFSEPGISSDALDVIARETNQPVYELSPVTDGSGDPGDYAAGMRKNAETLLKALNP